MNETMIHNLWLLSPIRTMMHPYNLDCCCKLQYAPPVDADADAGSILFHHGLVMVMVCWADDR